MQFRASLAVSLASLAASSASAAVFSTDDFSIFSSLVAASGQTVAAASLPVPPAPGGNIGPTYSGSAGGVTWTASATLDGNSQDLWALSSQVWLSTDMPGDDSVLIFSFSPGVRAAGGVFFATLINWAVPTADTSTFSVLLADGTAFEGVTGAAPGFTGFVSDTADIVSISVRVGYLAGGPNDLFPTASALYFAVPAPGAFALLGAAGLIGTSTRRR